MTDSYVQEHWLEVLPLLYHSWMSVRYWNLDLLSRYPRRATGRNCRDVRGEFILFVQVYSQLAGWTRSIYVQGRCG